MNEHLSDLAHATALFHVDSQGTYLSTRFIDLRWDSQINGESSADHYHGVSHDLRNLAALADRLEWMRELACVGTLHKDAWRTFSSLDVEQVFVQTRSAMDHITALLRTVLPKGGQLPESFRKLRDSPIKYQDKLQQFSTLIENAVWFDNMRLVRDELVHSGAQPTVFGDPGDGLIFQVHGHRLSRLVVRDLCMYNDNALRFDRYMAVLFANLIAFLDRLGNLLPTAGSAGYRSSSVRSYARGNELLHHWIQDSYKELQNRTLL